MTLPTIDSVPEDVTNAGQEFGYVNPPATVVIDLVNIPTDPDHQNAGINQAAYDAFIDAQIAATGDPSTPGGAAWTVTNQVMYDPEYSPKLEIDYDTAVRLYNYGRITFPGGRRWYVFYTPVYLNPNTTLFRADIDEFPSFTWGLGYSMIERGHYAVAASQGDTYGAEFLTAPEPIDAPPVRGVLDAQVLASTPGDWTVLVISANDLRGAEGGAEKFWQLHLNNGAIQQASTLATEASINSGGETQMPIEEPAYPWGIASPGAPTGTPENGFVPDGDLITLPGDGTAMAEANTVAAFERAQVSYPGISIPPIGSAPANAAAYWSRALDIAIHADPAAYGITDPDLSPIGESPHGLGIRINVEGATPAIMAPFGFSSFNSYTYTYQGPYVWDEPTPDLTQVFVPEVIASPVSTVDGVAAGGGAYLFTLRGFAEYMTIMQGAPWVIAGIVDIKFVPAWALSGGGDSEFTAAAPSRNPSDESWAVAAAIPNFVAEVTSATASVSVLDDWRAAAMSAVGANPIWGKLLTAQFTDLLVGNGDSMNSFRPDQWESPSIDFEAVTGAAHGDPSIRLIPTGYNELGSQMGIDVPVGGGPGITRSGFGIAASNTAQSDMVPFMNAFGTYSSWQVLFRQRELAQTLGIEGANLSLGAAGISNALGAITGAARSAFEGAVVGGEAGAALGLGAGLAGAATNQVNAIVSADNTIQLLDISTDGSFDIGAYQLFIAGQAAVYAFSTAWQALDANPGSGSPDRLASAWRAIIGQAFEVIISMPSAERVKKLISEWERYGYMIGQAFDPPQLNAMTKFTYWKTEGALITGTTPQEKRQTIAQAFDRGVTIWTDIADIGTDVTAENTPLEGITY